VIVAIVRRIVSLWRQQFPASKPLPRILIAAPSNAAVDEITKRLSDANRRGQNFSLMRVGIPSAVRADVKCILVDEVIVPQA
jgi:superfamily I DNA and/or RNA helicase